MRKSITTLFLVTLTSGMMAAQDPAEYLDEFIVKVKPEKRAEFDAINKKMVALNRRNNGDVWLSTENMYGEGNVVTFVSLRSGYGDVQKGMDLFMGAIAKPGGKAAAEKMFQDFNNTIISSRAELGARMAGVGAAAPQM